MNEVREMTVVSHDGQEYLCFVYEYGTFPKYGSEVKFIPIGTANEELTNAFYDTLYGDDNE